jgi:glycosyltransferase involved in cell wall biosynthesis
LEALAALGADRSRLRLVNWGVDLETFAPGRGDARSRLDLPDCPIVLSPRSLMPVYNPDVTIHAFGLVLKEVPYAMLLLKHYGEIPAAVQALLSKVPFRNRIRVVGRVPAENLPDYYRAANVTVSIASSDSSPRTVWEAMACGCPCVVSDLPWAHEWIKDGQDALVTAIEPSQVASSVIRLLRDEALAASLAHSGRQLVERHHARRSEIDRLVSEYTALSER